MKKLTKIGMSVVAAAVLTSGLQAVDLTYSASIVGLNNVTSAEKKEEIIKISKKFLELENKWVKEQSEVTINDEVQTLLNLQGALSKVDGVEITSKYDGYNADKTIKYIKCVVEKPKEKGLVAGIMGFFTSIIPSATK